MSLDEEYTFDGQRPHEKILAAVNTHPFVLFWPGLKTITCWVVAAALIIFWSNQYSWMIAVVLFIVGLGLFLGAYYKFSQSCFIVTSERLLKVEQIGMGKKVAETELEHIQNMSSDTTGIFRGMLNYGDLRIRIADEDKDSEMVVVNIPSPYEVQERIAGMKK